MPFQYEAYRDPQAGSIASLTLRRGDIAAQQAERQGAIRANAVANIGGSISNALGDVIRYKQQAPQREMQQMQLQAARQGMADHDQQRQEQEQAKHDEMASRIGHEILLGGGTPDAVAGAMQRAVKSGALSPDEAQQFTLMSVEHAEKIPDAAKALLARSATGQALLEKMNAPGKQPEPFTLGEGQTRFDSNGNQIASVPKAEKPAPAEKMYEVVVPGPGGKPIKKLVPEAELTAGVEQYREPKEPKAEPDVTEVTPGAVELAALNYKKTGIMPPLGMGDKHTRQRILNRAAELTPADAARIEAGGGDIAGNRAGYHADSASLTGLQKQRDAIGAFEQTAQKNIDIFLEAAGKVVDTGSPMANTLARQVSGKMLGSPDQAAYDAARQVAINEIAKITSNPNLSGTLSDSARHEVDAFNPQNATLKQTVSVMRLLKRDMQNRTTALDAQLAAIKGRIGNGSAAPPTQQPKPTGRYNPKTGKVEPL